MSTKNLLAGILLGTTVMWGTFIYTRDKYKQDEVKTIENKIIETGDSVLVDVISEYDISHHRIVPLNCYIGDLILYGYTDMGDKKMILNSLPSKDGRRITTLHEVEHIKDYNTNGRNTLTENQIDSLAYNQFKKIYNREPR